MNDLKQAMAELLGEKSTGHIVATLELAEIAGAELDAAEEANGKLENSSDLFQSLKPTSILGGGFSNAHVYRLHCRELIARWVTRKSLKPATNAELLLVFSRSSLDAPLDSVHSHAYWTLFVMAYPDEAKRIEGEVAPGEAGPWTYREDYPGSTDETLKSARNSFRDDSRGARR